MADPIVEVQLELESKKFEQELSNTKQKITKAGTDSANSFKKPFDEISLSGLTSKILGLAAILGGGALFKKSIDEAINQQNAINDLNRALAASGQFTAKASEDFQSFASSIQGSSSFSDDFVLKNTALIQSLARLDSDGLKRATRAAVDFSSALGIDLETASRLVGKAASGNIDTFIKYGVAIKKGADSAETFSNALKELENRFGGAAASKLNTFEGQLQRASNAFGDIFEGIGGGLTKSTVFVGLIKTIGDGFTELSVKASKISFDEIFSIDNIIRFGTAINDYIVAPLELVYNVGRVVFNGLVSFGNAFISQITDSASKAIGLLQQITGDKTLLADLEKNLADISSVTNDSLNESAAATKDSLDKIFEGSVYGSGEVFLENLRTNLEAAKQSIEESGIKNALQPQAETLSFADSFLAGFSEAEITLKNFTEKTAAFGKQIRTNLQAGIANGAGQAFAAFGRALATGQNALDAFVKAFLGSIGQIAIQQGASFILQGIAYQFVPGFQGIGTSLIAAGAALATFGGALTAVSGGGGTAASSSVGGGADGGTAGSQINDPRTGFATSQERAQPNTAVVVNIQGDVFDSEETGLRISNILRDASINQNVRATVFA